MPICLDCAKTAIRAMPAQDLKEGIVILHPATHQELQWSYGLTDAVLDALVDRIARDIVQPKEVLH